VSEQLLTPILIGYDFCITNGIISDFQRGKLILKYDDESTEIEIMNSREEARELEDCYETFNNRQVIALPTPLTDPCQLAMVKLPRPLNPSCGEVYPCFSEPGELRKEGGKGAFHIMCPSSGKADVEDNCSNKDCGVDDRNESSGKCNSIACSNEEHSACDVEGNCGVGILLVAATDRVAGNERKGYYNTVQNAKAQATIPDEREVSSQVVLRNINIEDSLCETQKEKLSTLLLKYQAHFTKKTREMQLLRMSIPVARWNAKVPKQ
jgi:hypothetical protein